jgi:transcriptional regulator with XRE-family HTH domain
MIQKIKRLRKQKKLTQIELSKALHVASTLVGNWESQRTSVPAEIVPKLCEVLETTPNELFGWETN